MILYFSPKSHTFYLKKKHVKFREWPLIPISKKKAMRFLASGSIEAIHVYGYGSMSPEKFVQIYFLSGERAYLTRLRKAVGVVAK